MKFNFLLQPFLFGLLLLVVIFTACEKNRDGETNYFSESELAALNANTCLTLDADEPYALSNTPGDGAQDRASGAKNKFWAPGQTLRVRFLNGSTSLQDKVFAYAEEWENYANINFVRVTSGTSDIRVLFSTDGNYSYLGRDNLGISQNSKTMNLDFTNTTSNDIIRRTSLHEFGHALGLNHEHQSPLATIPWNKPAVYDYYLRTGNWSKEKVDAQVLNKETWESSQHTSYDPKSIMQYPVLAALTTDGSSIPWNTQLSTTDKDFIGKIYSSQRIRVRHSANTGSTITFWLNGIYHTLRPNESLWVPAKSSGNQLSIWECPYSNCAWDNYLPPYGYNYKIVAVGSTGDLKLAYD